MSTEALTLAAIGVFVAAILFTAIMTYSALRPEKPPPARPRGFDVVPSERKAK